MVSAASTQHISGPCPDVGWNLFPNLLKLKQDDKFMKLFPPEQLTLWSSGQRSFLSSQLAPRKKRGSKFKLS